ncbi:MAG: hypothetical protein AAB505_01150 [Patescibacteria group bacterium]
MAKTVKSERDKNVRELTEKQVEEIIKLLPRILISTLPIAGQGLGQAGIQRRLHDDHDGTFEGELYVVIEENGDILVSAERGCSTRPLRFRAPMLGGGMSPRTWNALRILALAIELDNRHGPIKKP